MTHEYVRALDERIDLLYGSYLQTVRYSSQNGLICPECGGFKGAGYPLCRSCDYIHRTADSLNANHLLADRIAASVYAVEKPPNQTLRIMFEYKGIRPAAPSSRRVVKALLALAINGHADCLSDLSKMGISAWAMVPSTQQSPRFDKPHPLHSLIREVLPSTPEIRLRSLKPKTRRFDPHSFELIEQPSREKLQGNVLVIDDSWVTGGTAQSVAGALKLVGADQVSIYCVSRIVNLSFLQQLKPGATDLFNKSVHYRGGYCPWRRCIEFI